MSISDGTAAEKRTILGILHQANRLRERSFRSLLLQSVSDGNSQIAGAAIRIKALERKSNTLLHDLQIKLHKTFVTPIDPEDISLLSEHLDHLLDEIESISYRLSAYHLDPIPPLMLDLAARMRKCSGLVEQAFGRLSMGESVDEACNEILDMEEQADQLIRGGVTSLFSNERDPIALLKQKEIYDIFGNLSDGWQSLANELQNVAVKNS